MIDAIDEHITEAAFDAVAGRESHTRTYVEEMATIVPAVRREYERQQTRLRELQDGVGDPVVQFERLTGTRLDDPEED